MRIAMVSEHASPLAPLGGVDSGGQNVHVASLAGALAALGHEVTVFTRRDSNTLAERVQTDDGYQVCHLRAGPAAYVPKDELLPHVPQLAAELGRHLSRDSFDVVHSHFWMSGLAAVDAVRTSGTRLPVVHTFHALGTVKRRHQGDQDTSPAGRIELEARLCRDVDHVVATSHDEVRELALLGLPSDRSTVVPCGVDVDLFCPDGFRYRRTRRPRVLAVGRLVARKGVEDLIRALRDVPRAELVVAGGPPAVRLGEDVEARRLLAVADATGVRERLVMLGAVDSRHVASLMRSADVVAAVPWYEPFGIVPLEAMACARPVVGSDVGGLKDTLVDTVTGLVVPARSPRCIAAALNELLNDPDRRAELGRAGRRRVMARYRWSQVARDTTAVYRAVSRTFEPLGWPA